MVDRESKTLTQLFVYLKGTCTILLTGISNKIKIQYLHTCIVSIDKANIDNQL